MVRAARADCAISKWYWRFMSASSATEDMNKKSHPGAGSMDYFAGLDVSVKETSCLHCG